MRIGILGSGQVAQHLMAEAEKSGLDVVLIGREGGKSVSRRAYDPSRYWSEVGDLITLTQDIDVMINTSAFRDLIGCEKNPELASAINSELPGLLASKGPRQIFISTDYVFRGLTRRARNEEDIPDAKCVYGKTKAAGEDKTIAAGGAVVRIASPWGIYPSPERAHFVDAIVPKGLDAGKLDMPSDQYFSPTYLPDVAGTILEIASMPTSNGVYHCVNSGVANWAEFTGTIFDIIKSKVKVTGSVRGDELRPRYGQLENNRTLKHRHWAYALIEYLNGSERAEKRR